MKSYPSFERHQRGVGLLEIMVAVLVLSFGLLGLAALQARALQGNQSSLQRSQAVLLTYSIIDAMRVDRTAALVGAYNRNQCAIPGGGGTLAEANLVIWFQALKNRLGDVASTCGAIVCDGGGDCTVTVTWDDTRAGGVANQSIVTRTRL